MNTIPEFGPAAGFELKNERVCLARAGVVQWVAVDHVADSAWQQALWMRGRLSARVSTIVAAARDFFQGYRP